MSKSKRKNTTINRYADLATGLRAQRERDRRRQVGLSPAQRRAVTLSRVFAGGK